MKSLECGLPAAAERCCKGDSIWESSLVPWIDRRRDCVVIERARDELDPDSSSGRGRAEPLIVAVSALFGAQAFALNLLASLYMLSLGYSVAWLGAVVSAQGAFQFLLLFVGGTASDRFGERGVMAAGFLVTLGAALLFAFSDVLSVLIVAQLLVGASRAVKNPATQSYASRVSETHRARVIGRYRAAQHVGGLAGPLLGGLMAGVFGFGAAFGMVAGLNAVALLVTMLLPDLPRKKAAPLSEVVSGIPSLVTAKPLMLAGILAFGIAMSPAVFFSIGIAFLRESGVAVEVTGLLLTFFSAGAVAGGLGFARVVGRLGQTLIYALGLAGVGVGILLMAATGTMPAVLLIMPAWGAMHALGNSLRTVLAAAHSTPEQRGVAVGVVHTYWALALFVMPALLGGVASVVGLRATVAGAGAAVLLVGISAPLLFRLLLPRLQAAVESASP